MNSLVLFLIKLILFIAFTLTKQNEIYFRREHSISKPYGGILSIYSILMHTFTRSYLEIYIGYGQY